MRVSMVTDELGSVPPTELVTATRQRIVWTPANEDDITAAVERQWWRSRRVAWKLELTQPRLLEASPDNYMIPHRYTHNAHTVRRRTALYTRCMCSYKACTSSSFDKIICDLIHRLTPMWISKTTRLRTCSSAFSTYCVTRYQHAQLTFEIFTL
jgi:hypothetical protein